MQLSLGKLATILIVLLISVTVLTTGIGLGLLHSNFRSLEQQQDAEARDSVHNAAIAVRNQIRFYQGILQLISSNPQVVNLLEFGEASEIARWSITVGRLLPGTLGTALASPDGVVFGDPLALRVGPACQADLRHFSAGQPLSYPLLHTDVSGLEHFDLLTSIETTEGGIAGTLFVSFRLDILERLLRNMGAEGDEFQIIGTGDNRRSINNGLSTDKEMQTFRVRIPDTSWELELKRPSVERSTALFELAVADAVILVLVAGLIIFLVRSTLNGFTTDMSRVHTALKQVLEGHYEPSSEPTALKETQELLPSIEQLAVKIQHQRNQLRHQSLSDPLTGVFNRRYFDLMLGHLHEQSRRLKPAILVVIDLNDFKHINDEFGHGWGDRMLQETAEYLRGRVRATDIVARLGGDEFALILNHMDRDRLEEWLTALIHDHDHKLLEQEPGQVRSCQFSIGAAEIDAAVYRSVSEVYNAADQAMYAVKERRRIRHSRYAVAKQENITQITAAREKR